MTGFEASGGWPIQEGPSCFCHIFCSLHTLYTCIHVNMTLSSSLNSNGHQLGSSEYVILHCLLCPVKLSTELCMINITVLPYDTQFTVVFYVGCSHQYMLTNSCIDISIWLINARTWDLVLGIT